MVKVAIAYLTKGKRRQQDQLQRVVDLMGVAAMTALVRQVLSGTVTLDLITYHLHALHNYVLYMLLHVY
jgi:hypothetical protein